MSNDKIEIGLPDKMELYHRSSYIEIVRIWFGWKVIFMTAFAIFWDGFLFMWYSKVGKWANPILFYFPLVPEFCIWKCPSLSKCCKKRTNKQIL
jgi:hypothetical protein